MDWIDLRSDTVTLPTPEMRRAMADAEVGDDVFGEDPTVRRLEEQAAKRMGKESGLFVPSGTMGNLVAVLTHGARGDEAIVGTLAHVFLYEVGGMAALGGIQPRTVPNQEDGTLEIGAVEAAIRTDNIHHPTTRLICLENTQNRCAGAPLPVAYMKRIGKLARRHKLALHLDGARIFNAAVALGVPAEDLAGPADTVTFCLSKGLAAPAGSVLCGRAEFIGRGRRIRQQLGGGMRQSGILAAAGLVALEKMVDRLADDHRRAGVLAAGLNRLPGLNAKTSDPATNMIYVEVDPGAGMDAAGLVKALAGQGVRVTSLSPGWLRLVTHSHVDDASVDAALAAFRQVIGKRRGRR
jgi:threonine aldolase